MPPVSRLVFVRQYRSAPGNERDSNPVYQLREAFLAEDGETIEWISPYPIQIAHSDLTYLNHLLRKAAQLALELEANHLERAALPSIYSL
jgi:hypothetical protein